MAIPVIGDMHQFKTQFFESFPDIEKKYGKIAGFWLGPKRAVVINDYNMMVKAGQMEELMYRPPNDSFKVTLGEVLGEVPGVLTSSGRNWQEQRRFALHCLREPP